MASIVKRIYYFLEKSAQPRHNCDDFRQTTKKCYFPGSSPRSIKFSRELASPSKFKQAGLLACETLSNFYCQAGEDSEWATLIKALESQVFLFQYLSYQGSWLLGIVEVIFEMILNLSSLRLFLCEECLSAGPYPFYSLLIALCVQILLGKTEWSNTRSISSKNNHKQFRIVRYARNKIVVTFSPILVKVQKGLRFPLMETVVQTCYIDTSWKDGFWSGLMT